MKMGSISPIEVEKATKTKGSNLLVKKNFS